jgi:hypothetical protein
MTLKCIVLYTALAYIHKYYDKNTKYFSPQNRTIRSQLEKRSRLFRLFQTGAADPYARLQCAPSTRRLLWSVSPLALQMSSRYLALNKLQNAPSNK